MESEIIFKNAGEPLSQEEDKKKTKLLDKSEKKIKPTQIDSTKIDNILITIHRNDYIEVLQNGINEMKNEIKDIKDIIKELVETLNMYKQGTCFIYFLYINHNKSLIIILNETTTDTTITAGIATLQTNHVNALLSVSLSVISS